MTFLGALGRQFRRGTAIEIEGDHCAEMPACGEGLSHTALALIITTASVSLDEAVEAYKLFDGGTGKVVFV